MAADLVQVAVTGPAISARAAAVDMMVAMNPRPGIKDLASIEPGCYLFYIRPSRCRRRNSAPTSPIGVPLPPSPTRL